MKKVSIEQFQKKKNSCSLIWTILDLFNLYVFIIFLDPEYEFTLGPLRKLDVRIVAFSNPATFKITPIGEGTTCTGDSGGAIEFTMPSHVNIIIGILSKGENLPQSQCGINDVFVDIKKHTDWFDEIVFKDFWKFAGCILLYSEKIKL